MVGLSRSSGKMGLGQSKKPKIGETVNGKWKVLSKLGDGGFGAVYKVEKTTTKEEHAMKVELAKARRAPKLKMEVAVFKTFRDTKQPRPHICEFVSSGSTSRITYLVMELVGPSLADLQRTRPDNKFTGSTTARLATQSIDAIECLHRIGFLHRDIKPANFAMGRSGPQQRIVYMLDFGLCRKYVNKHGQLLPPRKTAAFRGTVRYASINTHLRKDLGRRDDLWSLLDMLVEFQQGELPWNTETDKNQVLKKKQETSADDLMRGMGKEYRAIMRNLEKLKFADTPNYAWYRQQLEAIMVRRGYKNEDPFDWESERRDSVSAVTLSPYGPDGQGDETRQ